VVDDEIIVTLPFTIYTVTYYKPPNSPQLLAKNFPSKDDPRVPLTQAEFLARAWRVARDPDTVIFATRETKRAPTEADAPVTTGLT
jgi:hypothetical protein